MICNILKYHVMGKKIIMICKKEIHAYLYEVISGISKAVPLKCYVMQYELTHNLSKGNINMDMTRPRI